MSTTTISYVINLLYRMWSPDREADFSHFRHRSEMYDSYVLILARSAICAVVIRRSHWDLLLMPVITLKKTHISCCSSLRSAQHSLW